ncbi:hypothetical protein ACDL36_09480, partial [Corynebacterium diphtheriae]
MAKLSASATAAPTPLVPALRLTASPASIQLAPGKRRRSRPEPRSWCGTALLEREAELLEEAAAF